jgi:rare lipoprotein A
VELERITFDDIRTGAWRRGEAPTALASVVPAPARAELAPLPTPGSATTAAPVPAAATLPSSVPVAVATPASAEVSFSADPSPPLAAGVATAEAGSAAAPSSRGFWVQLGVFRQHDGAHSFHQRVAADLDWLAPLLAVFNDETFFRLQAGPYPSRSDALASATRIREALQLVPVIVERR